MKRAIVFAVLLMCAHACLATTIHVPADQPTIQAGIDAAVTGDTVLVAPGSYSEQIDFMGRGIVVTSSDGPGMTFLNPSSAPIVSFVNGEPLSAELSGLTLRSTVVSDYHVIVMIAGGAMPLIQGNIFSNLTASVLVSSIGSHPRIVRNLFYSNLTGASVGISSGAADIVNNTFDGSGGLYSWASTVAKNNIITNSSRFGINGSFRELSYNDVWKNYRDYDGGANSGVGSISQDPQFWSQINQDFRLNVTSPCVDAGDPANAFDDPDGTRSDMGAFPLSFVYPVATEVDFGAGQHGTIAATLVPTIRWTYFDTYSTAQVAFELEMGTDNDWTMTEMWSTGVVMTGEDSVVYDGAPLSDSTTYYMRIRLYNGTNWGEWSYRRFYVHLVRVIHVPADRPTIQTGIDAAIDGDTVLVAPGSYPEQIDYKGKGIVVRSSDGPEMTVLNPANAPVVTFLNIEPTSAELSGFTVRNAIGDWSVLVANRAEPLIQQNIFRDFTDGYVRIYCYESHPRIIRNLFFDNVTGDACIGVDRSGAADIINNTFDGNSAGFYSWGHTLAKNNIITNSAEYGIRGPGTELSYNDVWNNNPDYYDGATAGDSSISENPLYFDAQDFDFGLEPRSPCVDAGDPSPAYNDPDGSRNDMGSCSRRFLPSAARITYGARSHGNYALTLTPEIRWEFIDTGNARQVAYELQVGSDRDWTAAELWSTGVVSSEARETVYSGSVLSDNTTYFLRLRVFNGFDWGGWTDDYFVVHIPRTIHVPADQPTIQAGIDAAVIYDTVLVDPATYNETIYFQGKHIIVHARANRSSTIIRSDAYDSTVVQFVDGEDSTSVLDGFVIFGGFGVRGIYCQGASPIIQNCEIVACEEGAAFCLNSAAKIRHNWIHDNFCFDQGSGIGGRTDLPLEVLDNVLENNFGKEGIRFYGPSSNLIIRGNLIRHCGASYPDKAGIYVYGRDCQITNNTIVGGVTGLSLPDCRGSRVYNNIIAFNTGVGLFPTSATYDYNLVWGNGTNYASGVVAGIHDFSADPLFCDTASGDFHLQGNSPCAPANNSCGVLIGALPVGCDWNCGDINGSSIVNITDAVYLLHYLFTNGPEPLDLSAGDVNQDGRLNIADVVYLINYVFVSGPAPCAAGE